MKLLCLCLVLTLANISVGLVVKKTDFEYNFGVSRERIEAYRKTAASTLVERKRTRLTKAKVVKEFEELQEKVRKLPLNTPALLASIIKLTSDVANLSNTDVGNGLAQILKVTTALQTNWGNITGKDVALMGKAICDVVSVVCIFIPPPYGTVVSSVVGLIGNLIGTQGGKPKTMSEVVREVMKQELQRQYMNQMSGKIKGALAGLDTVQAFLNGYVLTSDMLSDRDYDFMISQFDFLKSLELRGELMALIERMARSKKKDEAGDTMQLIDSYIVMTSMIEVLMHTMKSILDRDARTQLSATNLGYAIEASKVQSQQNLGFLRNPKQENGVLFSTYVPDDNPILEMYLDRIQVTSKPLSLPGCYHLSNKKDKRVSLRRTFSIGSKDAANFQFFTFNKGKSWTMKTSEGVVCSSPKNNFLEVNRNGCKMDNPRAEFRIYEFEDGGFLMINNQWPSSPLRFKEKGLIDGPFAEALSITGGDKDWSDSEPQYVWQLIQVKCESGK